MDYRMEHREGQQFLVLVRAFPNEISSDDNCLGETWSKFFKEFSPQTGYMQTDDTDYEIYFENGESGLFCELWVPVKKN